MHLFVDNKSGQPIYEQIYSQIKGCIISGELQEDAPLPSIRALAKDLRISVITTKRAYDELEREGFIYTVAAKGCFVAAQSAELLREENLKKIEDHMRSISALAAASHLTQEEILEMYRVMMQSEN
ncbi:MAG: GntR family transcriptional regulator [Lachnospiraceae bacterium]|jgi:GntR family transcriptional regulator|nr:GntR family transcriptional regulator [Lachnospiraceae bacterium]